MVINLPFFVDVASGCYHDNVCNPSCSCDGVERVPPRDKDSWVTDRSRGGREVKEPLEREKSMETIIFRYEMERGQCGEKNYFDRDCRG